MILIVTHEAEFGEKMAGWLQERQYVVSFSQEGKEALGYCQLNDMKPKLSAFVPPARTSSCTDHLLPTLKSLGAQNSIIDHLHQVTAKAKEILGESMEREKPLRLIR